MRTHFVVQCSGRILLPLLLLLASTWSLAGAQTNTARITGTVTGANGAPIPQAQVTARNVATNLQRNALGSDQGFYSITGLPPGVYELTVRRIGLQPQARQLRAQVGQTVTADFVLTEAAVELAEVEVVSEGTAVETQTPEVATNVSTEQIENLPLNNRNFLNLARLAPGVRTSPGSNNITSGALSADNVNVFIDGASFKNDILRGGVAGQDASLGNPFPQNAVQEFRVITQQYKAEYQKATSAIVTATTKSGTNDWTGNLFGFGQTEGLIAQDFFTLQRCDSNRAQGLSCDEEPELRVWQAGGSIGGPIVRDRLFFFGSYEGNIQNRANTVILGDLTDVPPTLADSLRQFEGTFSSPFRSHLFFGKLTYTPSEASSHRFELSGNVRTEYDIRNFGNDQSYENAEDFNNDVYTFIGKHQYTIGDWLNEATASFQRYRWNPIPLRSEPGFLFRDIIKLGGRCCEQDRVQDRFALRNDLTYTLPNLAGYHVFKGGVTLDFVNYDLTFTRYATPEYVFVRPNFAFPSEALFGTGDPTSEISNRQFGAYIQDDWSLNDRLTLNLGIRWDYESNMKNNDFVTPDSAVAAAQALAAASPCGDPNAPDFLKLMCDPSQYISTGDNRDAFLGAFQPRVGFSYDIFGNGRTTLFGGFGLYYDRLSQADVYDEPYRQDWAVYTFRFSADGAPLPTGVPTIAWDPRYLTEAGLQEVLASGEAPKPELWMLKNDTRPPKSYQGSIGVRQAFGDNYLVSLNYTGVRGHNFTTWLFANRNPDGSCCAQLEDFSNVLISSDEAQSWFDGIYLKLEKRFTEASRWGAQLAYTLGWADVEAHELLTGLSYYTPDDFERYPAPADERHHVTTNWIIGLPLDFRFSGIIDLGSGTPYNIFIGGDACLIGNRDCIAENDFPEGRGRHSGRPEQHSFIIPNAWAYRNVDLRVDKEFAIGAQSVGLSAAVYNVFNYDNFECYQGRIGDADPATGAITPNPEFAQPTCVITDPLRSGTPRRFQFGLDYTF